MVDLSLIGIATAFAAGVISFLSPCVLPLVPGYVSFVAGSSLEDLRDGQAPRLQALMLAITFVLGFSIVFVALGAGATYLGSMLLTYKYELGIVAGVIVTLFGLHMLGFTPFNMMNSDARFHLDVPGGRTLSALLLGIAFAFGWTPCIGPVLGAILALSASTADVSKGIALLTVYSIGLGLPFLLAALFTGTLLRGMRSLGRVGRRLQQAAGGLLVVMGLLMVTGQLEIIAYWLIETFPGLSTMEQWLI
ncbi:MAG: cytochrome c biogenesis CcdA family protein [Geminicoccaceae bacterium]